MKKNCGVHGNNEVSENYDEKFDEIFDNFFRAAGNEFEFESNKGMFHRDIVLEREDGAKGGVELYKGDGYREISIYWHATKKIPGVTFSLAREGGKYKYRLNTLKDVDNDHSGEIGENEVHIENENIMPDDFKKYLSEFESLLGEIKKPKISIHQVNYTRQQIKDILERKD